MSRRLLLLNGLAVLGVVINHTVGWGFVSLFWWTDQYLPVTVPNFDQLGSLSYFALRFFEQLATISIPAFLFVSGFFVAFAAAQPKGLAKSGFLANRIRYLVIPYVLWSLIMFAFEIVQGETYAPLTYVTRLLLGQAAPPFYFVPVLVQFYLLSPLLIRLARSRPWILMLIAALVQAAVHVAHVGAALNPALAENPFLSVLRAGWFFPGNFLWFALGIVAGFHHQPLKAFLQRARWLLLGSAVIFFALGMYEWEWLLQRSGQEWIAPKVTLIDALFCLSLLLSFLAFDKVRYPLTRQLNELGSRSFGIYLVHTLVLTVVARIVYNFAPWVLGSPLLFQLILFANGLAVPLLLMALVRITPARRYYSYQFG